MWRSRLRNAGLQRPSRGQRRAKCLSTPSWIYFPEPFATQNGPHRPPAATSSATVKPRVIASLAGLRIDGHRPSIVNYLLPRATFSPLPCAAKRRRSRHLPLKPRPRAGAAITPEVMAPRFPSRSACATDPASIPLGALEARRGLRHRAGTGCRVPDPVITRACVVQRRAQSCLPYGLPARSRSNARTALDFRSGVDPCQRMTLRIQD